MAEPWFGVLIDKASGAELSFHNRGEYLSTLYSGGYREKKFDEQPQQAAPAPAPARALRPRAGVAPQPETPRREPVNEEPVVETAPGE